MLTLELLFAAYLNTMNAGADIDSIKPTNMLKSPTVDGRSSNDKANRIYNVFRITASWSSSTKLYSHDRHCVFRHFMKFLPFSTLHRQAHLLYRICSLPPYLLQRKVPQQPNMKIEPVSMCLSRHTDIPSRTVRWPLAGSRWTGRILTVKYCLYRFLPSMKTAACMY